MPYKDPIKRQQYALDYNKNHKQEQKEYRNENILLNPWYYSYYSAQQRCDNPNSQNFKYYGAKGIKFLLTKEECKILWNRDKGWLLKKASIDRIDNDGDYTFDNCQFIEHKINSGKNNCKSVLQFDLQMNFIKKWTSVQEIIKTLKIGKIGVYLALTGKYKYSQNSIWKYENKT